MFEGALDHLIPPDESVPLKGTRFTDFEDQVEAFGRAVLPVALEERAALEGNAEVTHPGCCPFCGSGRVYLKKEVTQPELLSPQGEVVLRKQHARCRACGKTFSPSGSRLGVAR
jgi:transposase-like protein